MARYNEVKIKPGYCNEIVREAGPWPNYHQCSRKPTVDGKWCKQHDPQAVAKRKEEASRMYQAQVAAQDAKYKRQNRAYAMLRVCEEVLGENFTEEQLRLRLAEPEQRVLPGKTQT